MKRRQVYAMGQDQHWLKAVSGAADDAIAVRTFECAGDHLECLERLPAARPEVLLLVDATRQPDIGAVARRLYEKGWRRVVIVAADQNHKEARAVLKVSGKYDYLAKVYEPARIRSSLNKYLSEVEEDLA